MSIIMDNDWNLKEEIPTTRWWLMLKLKLGMDRRWEQYLKELRENLIAQMKVTGIGGDEANKAKGNMATHIITKLEKSAWATMPAEFLKQLGIPRVIRH
jgi:hypothetical protein